MVPMHFAISHATFVYSCVCSQRKRECPQCRQTIVEIRNGEITHKIADLVPEEAKQDAAREANPDAFVLMNDGTYLPHSDFVPCACCGQITDEDGEAFSAIQCDGILPDGGVCNRSYCWYAPLTRESLDQQAYD